MVMDSLPLPKRASEGLPGADVGIPRVQLGTKNAPNSLHGTTSLGQFSLNWKNTRDLRGSGRNRKTERRNLVSLRNRVAAQNCAALPVRFFVDL